MAYHLQNGAILADLSRTDNVSSLTREYAGNAFIAHGADIRHLTRGQNRLARLHLQAEFLRRFLQVVGSLGAVGQFLRFLAQLFATLFILELFFHLGTNLVECGRGRRLNGQHLIHGVALRRANNLRRILLLGCEDGAHEIGGNANAGKRVPVGDEVGRDSAAVSRFLNPTGFRFVQERARLRFRLTLSHLLLQQRLNVGLDVFQRPHVRILLVFEAHDMKPVAALQHIAGLTFRHGENHLLHVR